MSRAALVLAIVATDRTFSLKSLRDGRAWVGRCIHCNTQLVVEENGATSATIEHLEPRHHGGTDALENVALACARCNASKGVRLDARRRSDPTLRRVVEALLARRADRWRAP